MGAYRVCTIITILEGGFQSSTSSFKWKYPCQRWEYVTANAYHPLVLCLLAQIQLEKNTRTPTHVTSGHAPHSEV